MCVMEVRVCVCEMEVRVYHSNDFISSCLSVQNKPTLRRTSSELYVDKGKHDL